MIFMENYIKRLKSKIKPKKLDAKQTVGIWIFVVILNIVGFAGYFYFKITGIQLGN